MSFNLCGKVEKLISDLNETYTSSTSSGDFSTRLLSLNSRHQQLYDEAEIVDDREAMRLLDIYDKRRESYFNQKSQSDRSIPNGNDLSYNGA